MEMHKVKSSNIAEIGHDGTTMHVKYTSGQTYVFKDVSAKQFKELMSAKSHGSHLYKMGIKGVKLEKKHK